MRTIDDIRTECETHGICADYIDRWRSAKSRKELFDMGCSIQGMEFLVRCMDAGYGFSADEICSIFGAYLNYRYISVQHKETEREYDGAIWCRNTGPITAGVTCTAILCCNADVVIKPFHVCHLFVDRESCIKVICPATSIAIIHSDGSHIDTSQCEGRVKTVRINQNGE